MKITKQNTVRKNWDNMAYDGHGRTMMGKNL